MRKRSEALYEKTSVERDELATGARERMRQLGVDIFASKGKIEAEDKVGQKVLEF